MEISALSSALLSCYRPWVAAGERTKAAAAPAWYGMVSADQSADGAQ